MKAEPAKDRTRWQRAARGIACALTAALTITVIAVAITWQYIGQPPLDRVAPLSVTVIDRNDRLLRAFTTTQGHWRLPLAPHEVDPKYLQILTAFEDRRFRDHWGVDPIAVGRAVAQAITHRRLVSGGSTLTMQVARLLDDEHGRSAARKWRQSVRALQLEKQLTKDQILALYLRLAPFGGNIEGVRAASLAYLGKEPKRLSLGEAALLVAIPQSPEARRPDRAPEAARRARDRVLARALSLGVISRADHDAARIERVPHTRREFPKLAAHLAESEADARKTQIVHRLTIDAQIQAALEQAALDHARPLGQGLSAALLAVDHATGHVLAHVGSAGYFDEARGGANDMTKAVRSPGSTLKPFIYGLAFEAGLAHPETLIEDRPTRFGAYVPKNFDQDWHGTVSIREALAQSLNIPAVKVLDAVGPARLYGRFQRTGVTPVLPKDAEPNLAMALGGVGLRLSDLATLYASLARGGSAIALTHRRDQDPAHAARSVDRAELLSPVAAWHVGDILRHAPPPANARGGQIAYKTGTSYGYRDAWAVGFDGRHTIAVWVGRPDGAATPGLTGRTAAAPLLFDAFQRISERRVALAAPPSGAVRTAASALPPPLRHFADAASAGGAASATAPSVQIAFPPDRAEIEIDQAREGDTITLKAEGGTLPLTWLVDGQPMPSDPTRRDMVLRNPSQGFMRISVIDANGRADRVSVRAR